jgi:hypothetical protein
MFGFVSLTWNPIVGCLHNCVYCWARRQARRLKARCDKCGRFEPHFHYSRLNKEFKPETLVFVCDMSDLFGWWTKDHWIKSVLNHIRKFPATMFFLETKNPGRINDFLDMIPKNVILSTTIETSYPSGNYIPAPFSHLYIWNYNIISRAPDPVLRASQFVEIEWPYKHVSIEPILDFDMEDMIAIIEKIKPSWGVSIGYDNYGHRLPEPPLAKTKQLIRELEKFTRVEVKTLRKAWYEKP